MVLDAGDTNVREQLKDGSLGHAGHAASRPDGVAFYKGADDVSSAFGTREDIALPPLKPRWRTIKGC
jgi:hypothetical protein